MKNSISERKNQSGKFTLSATEIFAWTAILLLLISCDINPLCAFASLREMKNHILQRNLL